MLCTVGERASLAVFFLPFILVQSLGQRTTSAPPQQTVGRSKVKNRPVVIPAYFFGVVLFVQTVK